MRAFAFVATVLLAGCGSYDEEKYVEDWVELYCHETVVDCGETVSYATEEECVQAKHDQCDDPLADCYLSPDCVFDPAVGRECTRAAEDALVDDEACTLSVPPECDPACEPDFG